MIVRYQGTKEPDTVRALTAGGDYVVITKEPGRFRVVDDAGQRSDYPRDEFAIVDDLPYHEIFSGLEQIVGSPESIEQFEAVYERLLERIRARRPDLRLPTRPGVVLPIQVLERERRLIGFGDDPRIARAADSYRRLVELGDLVIVEIRRLLEAGSPPARVYAACALAELRGDLAPLRRLEGDRDQVLFVRSRGCTVEPLTVDECGRRLRRIGPTVWDI